MVDMDAFLRRKNITFFLALVNCASIRIAASEADLTKQHATRLIKQWRVDGLIIRVPKTTGSRYQYTDFGKAYVKIFEQMVESCGKCGIW